MSAHGLPYKSLVSQSHGHLCFCLSKVNNVGRLDNESAGLRADESEVRSIVAEE